MATDVFPVCSPDLGKSLSAPKELARLNLLHEVSALNDPDYPSWQSWFSSLNITDVDARQGPIFTMALMALQAAIDGQGVALAQRLLVEYDIAAGRLVCPFSIETPLRLDYYLIYAPDMANNPAFEVFYAWLRNEAGSSANKQA